MIFSIICLTYKRIELLEESVFSVLQQTHQDFELIIINDFNNQKLNYDHPKVKIFNLDTKFETIGEKRNFGIKHATGDLILQLDDDDFLLPDYLENLHTMIGKIDWLHIQKPIMYYNNHSKIHLSPVTMANTFLYRRESVGTTVHYDNKNFDELTPFFAKVSGNGKFSGKFGLLPPEKCGYIYRQDVDDRRKYSMVKFQTETIAEQTKILESIEPQRLGNITLVPKWNEDYITIIKSNFKIVARPKKYISELEKTLKDISTKVTIPDNGWKSVKFSWENAEKFITSMSSRGIGSTISNLLGINDNGGTRVSEEIYKQRQLSCFGDASKNIEPCSNLKHVNVGYFCGTCGCGDKKLAKLNSDFDGEYTKLHYPDLQCPLKKLGFSNYESISYLNASDIIPPLSVIIPVLNDNDELNLTIKSIRETSPPNVEIIVIDDASDSPVKIYDDTVKVIRLEKRIGVGGTRHLGASSAKSDYLLFVDSHMRFDEKWYNNALRRLISKPSNIVWCAVCLGLDKENMDIKSPKGFYHGAKLCLWDETENQTFEGKWMDELDGDEYEISCLMGACYFFHKSWFFHIKGTESLKMWGSDEPLLSIKTWLSGGSIRLMKDVRIGHKFRLQSSYSTNFSYILYNKLRSMKMLFSDELYNVLQSKIELDGNKQAALQMLELDKNEIELEKEYYKTIFVKDENWLCEKFNLMPTTIGIVMLATNSYFILGLRFIKKFLHYYKGKSTIKFYFFSDEDPRQYFSKDVNISFYPEKHENWMDGTNSKFKNILNIQDDLIDTVKYVYYVDADTNINKPFTEEWFLGDLVGGEHFGNKTFLDGGSGFNRDKISSSYVPIDSKLPCTYYYGAFFGGKTKNIIQFCETLRTNQLEDKKIPYEPAGNDESYINHYFHYNPPSLMIPTEKFEFIISDKGGIGETRDMNLNTQDHKSQLLKNKDRIFDIQNNIISWI
jgi:glycosyltransferase involved in cell wall biosynthesis